MSRGDTRKAWKRALAVLFLALLLIAPAQVARLHGQLGGVSGDVEIAGLLDAIEANDARKQRLDQELSAVDHEQKALRKSIKGQVRALYRITRAGVAPIGGGVEALLRHVARVTRLRRIVESQGQRLSTLHKKSSTLRADTRELSQALEQNRSRLAELQQGGGRRAPIPTASAEDLPGAPGAAATGLQPSGDGTFYGIRLVDPAPVAGFASQRGKLASPISGEMQLRGARRRESDGPGLEFVAPVGTAVRAAAAGRVAFSDHYGSYGRLVILDHGDGYYTVYGGLGAVEVRVGDDLSRSARIGSIGSDFSPSALFFEVRQGTRTLEPRGWLGF